MLTPQSVGKPPLKARDLIGSKSGSLPNTKGTNNIQRDTTRRLKKSLLVQFLLKVQALGMT